MSSARATMELRRLIRDVPDFPKKGIVFKDITPLLLEPAALQQAITQMAEALSRPDAVVAIESRGFLFGAPLALHWKVPLVPARKIGKLPSHALRETYALEYGTDALEIHSDALRPGQRTVIVDDLLATGGTAAATARLVEKLGATVHGLVFLIELKGLAGRAKLAAWPTHALLELAIT